ncbi:unnamed protein product [Rotaria socialis]|uniref:Uncharacterized protein n=1 Tax=Rotaria socialis TaxID=392032 RepID=A0A821G9S2_9BILA|nr:unnamed protein product [Rotaria socialis]
MQASNVEIMNLEQHVETEYQANENNAFTTGSEETTTANRELSNDEISNFIVNCIKKDVTNIHLFAYVINVAAGGINEEDLKAMIYTKKRFPDLSQYMAIIATNCEHMNQDDRETLHETFFMDDRIIKNKLRDYFQQGIFYMGCLRQETFEHTNCVSLCNEYKNVSEMRTKFIKKCIECQKAFNVHHRGGSCITS